MAVFTLTLTISPKIYEALKSEYRITPSYMATAVKQKAERDLRQKLLMRQRRAEGKA